MSRLNKIGQILMSALVLLLLAGCAANNDTQANGGDQSQKLKVGLVIDSGTENDRSFNQYSLEGARRAAEDLDLEFTFLSPEGTSDYEAQIERLIHQSSDLIVTVGFRMGDPTDKAAQRNPDIHFAIVDNAYFPCAG